MSYTDQQIEFLCRFENGNKWSLAQEDNLELLLMLDSDGLLSHHEDTKPDWITLSEKGKQVVFNYREKKLAKENHIKELAKADADKKADRAIEHRFQLINSLLTAAIGGAITLFVEHFFAIVSFIKGLFH